MKIKKICLFIAMTIIFSGTAFAKNDKEKSLPPGLQKKADRGKSLPPGWQKKLAVGEILDKQVYEHGDVIHKDIENGLLTIKVEGKIVKLINNTREIIEILDGL